MTRSGARLLLSATAASCAAFLLFLPRAVEPWELPALTLDPDAAEAVLEADTLALEGDDPRSARRVEAVDRDEKALREAIDGEGNESLASLARRYGIVENERVVAPRLVVRAFLKARWNTSAGLPPTTDLEGPEIVAYFGWLALEADEAPAELREEALEAYGAAGGDAYDEAIALIHARRGHHGDAFLRFKSLYESTGQIRFRNYARASDLGLR